jgi:hypothetical protein
MILGRAWDAEADSTWRSVSALGDFRRSRFAVKPNET